MAKGHPGPQDVGYALPGGPRLQGIEQNIKKVQTLRSQVTCGSGRNCGKTRSIEKRSEDAQLGSCPSDQAVAPN